MHTLKTDSEIKSKPAHQNPQGTVSVGTLFLKALHIR